MQQLYKYFNMESTKTQISLYRKAINDIHVIFDLVYYITGGMIRNYSHNEIKNEKEYIENNLIKLIKFTFSAKSKEGKFYYNECKQLQKEFNNIVK